MAQRAALVGNPVRAQALVLLPVDEPLDLAWRKVVLIQAQALEHAADQEQLVPGIDDLESFREPCFAPVNSQQPVRQAMERADPEVPRGKTQQGFDAMSHFPGGLVGEGYREEMLGEDVLDQDQPGDPVDQYPGLAAARARQHEDRMPGRGRHRFPLGIVQRIDDRGDVHAEFRMFGRASPGYSGQKVGI